MTQNYSAVSTPGKYCCEVSSHSLWWVTRRQAGRRWLK